ncbi:organic cation transporter protein-like [Battus philenor]|uniref:organic cation transporter protein-like n=1 Tax=Battus philenor TaxID=42288 RepID=UPI0035D00023
MGKGDDGLDAVLSELGHFGRYQLMIFSLILIPILFSAVYNSQYIFAVADVNYRCMVPECETWPTQYPMGEWEKWAFPEKRGRCERLKPIGSGCSESTFDPVKTVPCDHWVYENNNSIVAEFDLGCEEWKRTTVGTIHSAGIFMALPLTAYVSDTFGRRVAFIATGMSPAIVGIIRSFSPNYIFYICFELLDAVVGAGVYTTGFVLALEMVGIKKRVLCGNIISSTFALGQALVAVIAWAVPYWRNLTRVLYAPSLLFFLYYFVIEESVRWLLSKGNKKEAARIIFKAAAINNRKLSPESIKQLTEDSPEDTKTETAENSQAKPKSIMRQVFKSKVLMCRLCVCAFWWVTVTFIYYGLSINSVSLAGNSYVNYILTSLIEIPGYVMSVLTLDRFGRKRSIMTAYFVCGISLVSLPFIPPSMIWLQTSLNLFGKLCISMVFSSIYVYTGELYPTGLRHRMMAACSMAGRIGQMVAPQTPLLMTYMASLPYLLFGVMSACSGFLMILTPETLSVNLPDTIQQAESIAVKEKKVTTLTVN